MTEPEVNGNQGLKQAMGGLLPLAAGKDEQARVHALNVLRTLYRDTRLGKSVMCYVSAGMRSALEGFSHPAWRVRNASTLLFSALMMRIFGVNRSRQDIERKNCLTGNVFFQRFPELLPFLLERIADLVCRINDHAGLYPILLLLGRLVPSLADSKLGRFMHLLDFCAGSPLHGVRVASSRAYGALLSAETRIRVLPEKMRSLASMKGNVGGNLMHGILLQIRTVLEMSGLSEELVASLREPLREGCWIATSQYAIASAEYVHLLTVCNVKLDEVLKIVPVTDELIPGGDHFEAAITKYKLTFGVPADARTDSEKMATLEFHLDQNPTSPVELMQRVLQDPSKEHPDVQRMAYELATRVADELDKPRERVDHLLDRLFQVSYPSVAVALFGLVAALVTRIAPSSLHGAIEALRRYSATNQDPGMRRVAADLAYNVLAAHGRAVLTSNPASHIALAEGLVNLVLDNDVHVRNRIVDGVATITANELCARTPLEAVLALCSETSPAPQEFGQFLVDLAAADGDAALAWLNNDQNYDPAEGNLDEQPFEKGELNTFYDALVVAESCRRALEHLRPRLTGRLSMPKLSIAQEAALDELEEQIRHVSDCELASNRQLDAGLVLLGQRLTARAMVKDRLQISERPLVNNVYFVRFAQLGN
ncbi:thyroid adenoma-associated protein-like [Tropilaelaps mercedesae]|uniref:tRNA (32-2'-O)-methyltransferase regulator THADA n=1 Tax=Tropilaelaps mercedesae TaxID=418985 RepID=A0A1V9XCJ4_9ACAR|nr:thyroid adenoma-associated protein-like [Tropilaelaps mercedesae]